MNDRIQSRLLHQYGQIDFLINGLSKEFLTKRHNVGKWSIHEHVAHMGRYQEIFAERINLILNNKSPKFERYRAENDNLYENWVNEETRSIIVKTKANRQTLAEMIISLNHLQTVRTGSHPKLGKMNIIEWSEFFLLHESHHLYIIFWLKHENSLSQK